MWLHTAIPFFWSSKNIRMTKLNKINTSCARWALIEEITLCAEEMTGEQEVALLC